MARRQGRGAAAQAIGRHRPGRRRRRQQGRGRGRPGHHVRLRLPRDAGADAGADPVRAQDPAHHFRSAPRRAREGARTRRQEPGDGPLHQWQAGRSDADRRLAPASRSRSFLRRRRGDRPPLCRQGAAGRVDHPEDGLARQPDRQVLHRRSRRRLRPHRPQDHRRHLRRRGAARRRRLLRQGPDQGRPLGRLRRALSRQERRRRRPRRALHAAALLRHRRRQAAVDLRRSARHRPRRRKQARAGADGTRWTCRRAASAST